MWIGTCMNAILKGKKIILGVCGGIAAYKSVELLRLLKKAEADVRVIMTRNACAFVGPMTFKALSGRPVCLSLFEKEEDASIRHIQWAQEADAMVVAPATANIVGKMANGIADDPLSTFLTVVRCPVIVCPSMNTNMFESRAVRRNLETLRADGFLIVEPSSGQLACGTTGPGRLPEPEEIVDRLIRSLLPKDFEGKKVLVTAGPTRESIDPVRFISNPSSGKMGYAIARAAEYRGARVVLVSGPTALADPVNVSLVRVETAEEMAAAVFEQMEDAHLIVKAAAVSDYRPVEASAHKIKKENPEMVLVMRLNPDILREAGRRKKSQFLVGFAAETQELERNARKKLSEKNLDMIVGNLVNSPGSGFNTDTNKVIFFYRDGGKEVLDSMEKDAVAHLLLDRVKERLVNRY